MDRDTLINYRDKVKESSRTSKCLPWKVSYLCLCCAGHPQLSQANSIESLHLVGLNKIVGIPLTDSDLNICSS